MTSFLSVLFLLGILIIPTSPWLLLPDLLTDLQFWNGFDTGLVVVEKNLIFNMEFEVMTRDGVYPTWILSVYDRQLSSAPQ